VNFSADLSGLASDLPTLLGVSTGIAVLAGLICMVLHLFSKTKYPRARHFADAHHGPPVFFASDTGNVETFFRLTRNFLMPKLFPERNSTDNTVKSPLVTFESKVFGFDRLLYRSAIFGEPPQQRCQRLTITSRCGSLSCHIAVFISFKRPQRPNLIRFISVQFPFQ
jgi:hypothetical protein